MPTCKHAPEKEEGSVLAFLTTERIQVIHTFPLFIMLTIAHTP